MDYISENDLEFAGAYRLRNVYLYTSSGERIEITDTVGELNLYSNIYSPFLTGNIIFTDTLDLIDKTPFIGEETLSFEFFTPGVDSNFVINNEEFPLKITRIASVKGNEKTQSYVMEFASPEFKRNNRVRCKSAYRGGYDEMVEKILRNDLKTSKKILLEPTQYNQKIVGSMMQPSELIQILSNRSISTVFNTAGYLFFEDFFNTFHYRSYTSLYYNLKGKEKQPYISYNTEPVISHSVESQLRRVKSYDINRSYDHTVNTRSGMYASRLIEHDSHTKTYKERNFNYKGEFEKSEHLSSSIRSKQQLLAYEGYVDEFGNTLFDFPDAKIFTSFTSGDVVHNETSNGTVTFPYNSAPIDDYTQRVTSTHQSMKNCVLSLTVHGLTTLIPGMVIDFNAPSIDSHQQEDTTAQYYSGHYVITKVRHRIVSGAESYHETILECVKDSLNNSIPVNSNNHHRIIKSKGTSTI